MFLIDIPFKGCQGRSNLSSVVHAVSMIPHAFLIFFLHTIAVLHMIFTFRSCSNNFCACGVDATAFIVHAVSMTPHAFWKIRIRMYIRKGFSPLIRSPGRVFWGKKTEGRKSRDTVPLNSHEKSLPKKSMVGYLWPQTRANGKFKNFLIHVKM
jgi:hypothetical protein